MMARIACETETSLHKKGFPDVWLNERTVAFREIIADAAYHSARSAGVVALAVGTTSRRVGAPARQVQAACSDLCVHFERTS